MWSYHDFKKRNYSWQDTEYVFRMFAKKISTARRRYQKFVKKGISYGRQTELVGGGLIRSMGGGSALKALRKAGAYTKGDERILGDGYFVENVLTQAEEELERKYRLKAEEDDFDMVVDRVAHLMGLKREQVLSTGKYKQVVKARSVVCYWCMREIGISQSDLAQTFGLSQPAIRMSIKRGEQMVNFNKLFLLDAQSTYIFMNVPKTKTLRVDPKG